MNEIIKEEEEKEVKKEKGEEKYIFLEEFPKSLFSRDPISFDRLIKLIPRIEGGKRVRVYRRGGFYYPLTEIGTKMLSVYKTVGFSYVPAIVVGMPEKEKLIVDEPYLIDSPAAVTVGDLIRQGVPRRWDRLNGREEPPF